MLINSVFIGNFYTFCFGPDKSSLWFPSLIHTAAHIDWIIVNYSSHLIERLHITAGSLNWVPASAGVKAEKSPLPGSRSNPIWHVISRSGVVILIMDCYIRFTYLLFYWLPGDRRVCCCECSVESHSVLASIEHTDTTWTQTHFRRILWQSYLT